ncbi:MAG: hypothetical protein FJ087_19150 [Deltaproteobacteria bacterium]|nr:hypothetical protein [Deltaproteobacteria bacterium]
MSLGQLPTLSNGTESTSAPSAFRTVTVSPSFFNPVPLFQGPYAVSVGYSEGFFAEITAAPGSMTVPAGNT